MGIYLKGLDFYPAVISREANQHVVRFIDVPDCLAFGASAIEAEIEASRVLKAHFRFLERQGCPLPSPSVMRHVGQGGGVRLVHIMSPIQHSAAAARDAYIPLAKAA